MIERNSFGQCLVCDTCDEEGKEYEHDDFHRMIADAKEEGWRMSISCGEWAHKCPDCCGAKGDFDL